MKAKNVLDIISISDQISMQISDMILYFKVLYDSITLAKSISIEFTILYSSKFYEQTHIFLRLHIYILHGSDTLQLESATE